MRQHNDLIRRARLARRSPSGSGRVLSRQELAEAVNAHLYATTGRVFRLDGGYVGMLERGETRWPNAMYRAGFRAVLGAATDAELGLYINRQSASDRDAERLPEHADRLPGHALVGGPLALTEIPGPPPMAESGRVQVMMGAGAAVTVVCAENGPAYLAVVAGSVRVLVEPAHLDAASGREHLMSLGDGAQVYALIREPDDASERARVVA